MIEKNENGMSNMCGKERCIGIVKRICKMRSSFFFFQAEDGIRDLVRSRGLGDVYKRQAGRSSARLETSH